MNIRVVAVRDDGGADAAVGHRVFFVVCVAVVVDDIEVALGRRARRSVTDEREVTDRCDRDSTNQTPYEPPRAAYVTRDLRTDHEAHRMPFLAGPIVLFPTSFVPNSMFYSGSMKCSPARRRPGRSPNIFSNFVHFWTPAAPRE